MNDILDKIGQICRVCLLEQTLMFSLQTQSYSNEANIYEMLLNCTSIQIELNDNLPQLVCSNCLGRLEYAYQFKQDCEKSDQILRKLLLENIDRFDTKLDLAIINPLNKDAHSSIIPENDLINVSSMVKVELKDEVMDEDIKDVREQNNAKVASESESSVLEYTDSSSDSPDSETLIEVKKKLLKNKKNAKQKRTINNNKVVQKTYKELEPKRLKLRQSRYACQSCDKSFKYHKRFWQHRDNCPFFSCYVCFKQFLSKDTLNKHLEEDHCDKKYVCEQQDCENEFKNYYLFLLHKKSNHGVMNYLKCYECGKEYDCHEQWDIHIQKHIANPYQCKQCVERFPTRRKLQVHVRIHPDYFKCEQCLKTFYSSKNLSRHKKIHEASFVCEECGRKFHHNYLLKKHIDHDHKGLPKSPSLPKNQMCSYCGQFFRRLRDLNIHIRTHTGQKPFACSQCDYRIHDKNLLNSHLRSHTGIKPYNCEICGKTFATKSYLTIHIRFHTGDRPYKCSHAPCEKGFTNSKDLKVHERTHTGVKLYHCNICNNSFTTLHYFKVHTKKHADANRYNQ